MNLVRSHKGSVTGGVILAILLISFRIPCEAQENGQDRAVLYDRIYKAAAEALKQDPLIQNGVYYTYPYYNAEGHPFLGGKEFESGSIVFRGKEYDGLSLNYDLFNQLIILSREYKGVLQMNILDTEFVSGFQLKGKKFIQAAYNGQSFAFYQQISENTYISCFYGWYKDRREIRDSGNRSIFSFSEEKSRRFLFMEGQLQRYKSNNSFVKLFPEPKRAGVKDYMQKNRILVMEASDQAMNQLIEYCNKLLEP
jgi:hypothetical protein